MLNGIPSYQRNLVDQPVAASTTLVTIGDSTTNSLFSFTLAPGKTCIVEASLPFSVGATGGFKFQVTSNQTLQDYETAWEAIDGVTASPGVQVAVILTSQAAFANAWAVAGNHQCNLLASFKGHATATATITIQFACNSAANAINILKGAWLKVVTL